MAGTGSFSLGKEICLSAPSAGATGTRMSGGESAPCELSPSRSWSVLLQCLQMCTNKGGLKQNESKQTNGIRVMGVGGLVHSDKHNDALCVCVCVFLCLGDYQWLGVWCVWLGDCFWVSLCVCLSVYVFVIMCVYIYSFSTCVNDKCVFYVASQKQVSAPPSACVCLYASLCFPAGLGHISFLSFIASVCICVLELLPKPVCLYWTSKLSFTQY